MATVAALPVLGACRRSGQLQRPESCAVPQRASGPGRALDGAEWEALRAACARLLPTDQDPGAEEANVVNYIDSQLSHPPISAFRAELAAGVAQMDELARASGARRFVELAPSRQDEVLRRLQRGVRMTRGRRRQDSRHFFVVLLSLTLEGFLGHPLYGGNRDRVGWRFMGFDPRPPHPRCPYASGVARSPGSPA